MPGRTVFSTACFPATEYIAALIHASQVSFDTGEHFVKQTNRNRYHILSANGILTMHIPVIHEQLYTLPIREIRISYDAPWQRTHWRTLTASYNRSAWFEFYADDLHKLFFKKNNFLFDFNESMLHWIFHCLKREITFSYLHEYHELFPDSDDKRFLSDRKNNVPCIAEQFKSYPQVFEPKEGFISNLSFTDLLFNTGPAATDYLPVIR